MKKNNLIKSLSSVLMIQLLAINVFAQVINVSEDRALYENLFKSTWQLKNTVGSSKDSKENLISIDLNPLQQFHLQRVQGQDLQLLSPLLSPQMGRKIRVAVLDTGVDVNHPYLAGRIARNETECKILDQYNACLKQDNADTKACFDQYMTVGQNGVDEDGDGYPADCYGWSLNSDKDTPDGIIGTPQFTDEIGHGTHVAGLIASVSDQIEIIPVQVINNAPNQPVKPFSIDLSPSENNGRGGYKNSGDLAERVARGIIYAINAHVDVINLSIGWPDGVDSQIMKDAIAEAQAQGILVVAAAGNDSTQALLRPCQYPGVICVGATRPDGAMAYFSNFGYGVDIAAPGVSIRSTIPMNRRSIRIPGLAGMDELSGTSQATPLVAGVIADMLSRGVLPEEIYPRLILGARPILPSLPVVVGPLQTGGVKVSARETYQRYVLSGQIDEKRSMAVKEQALILNADKETAMIDWDRKSSDLKFQFQVKNYWMSVDVNQVTFDIKSKSDLSIYPDVVGYTLLPLEGDDGIWDQGEIRTVEVTLKIKDTSDASLSKLPSDLGFTVKSLVAGKLNFTFETRAEVFFRFLKESSGTDLTTYPINGKVEQGMKLFLVDEVYDNAMNDKDYMAYRNNEDSVDVALVRYANQSYNVERTVHIPMAGDAKKRRLQQRIRMDINSDGQSEYVLVFVEFKDGKAATGSGDYTMSFYIFDNQMRLRQKAVFYDTRALIPFQYYWLKVGNVMRPAWVGEGLPVVKNWDILDLTATDINAKANTGKPGIHFYYLDEKFVLRTIEPTIPDTRIVDIIQPSYQQIKSGVLPVLVAKNFGTELKQDYRNDFFLAYVQNLQIGSANKINNISINQNYRNLIDTRVDKVLNLTTSADEYRGTYWFGNDTHQKQRVTMIDFNNNKIYDQLLSSMNTVFDNPLRVRSAYLGKNNPGIFLITNSEIEYHDFKSNSAIQRSLNKYTFIGDDLIADLQFPLTVQARSNKDKYPALFTTEGAGLNRGVKMIIPYFETQKNAQGKAIVKREVISPARVHMQAPKGCRSQDAPVFRADSGYSMDYYCGDRILRLNLSF